MNNAMAMMMATTRMVSSTFTSAHDHSLAVDEPIGVVPDAEITTRPTTQRVSTELTDQHIVPAHPEQDIVTRVADQPVVAGETEDRIRASSAEQHVMALRAHDQVEPTRDRSRSGRRSRTLVVVS